MVMQVHSKNISRLPESVPCDVSVENQTVCTKPLPFTLRPPHTAGCGPGSTYCFNYSGLPNGGMIVPNADIGAYQQFHN